MAKVTLVKEAEEKVEKRLHDYKVEVVSELLIRKESYKEGLEKIEKMIEKVEEANSFDKIDLVYRFQPGGLECPKRPSPSY